MVNKHVAIQYRTWYNGHSNNNALYKMQLNIIIITTLHNYIRCTIQTFIIFTED